MQKKKKKKIWGFGKKWSLKWTITDSPFNKASVAGFNSSLVVTHLCQFRSTGIGRHTQNFLGGIMTWILISEWCEGVWWIGHFLCTHVFLPLPDPSTGKNGKKKWGGTNPLVRWGLIPHLHICYNQKRQTSRALLDIPPNMDHAVYSVNVARTAKS